MMLQVHLDVRVTNPLNGSQGLTRRAALAKFRARRTARMTTCRQCEMQITMGDIGAVGTGEHLVPVVITVTRVAPRPLDQHDGLGAALKPIVDGVADYLGVKDNDKRIAWKLEQRRGRVREYCVEISIASAAVDSAAQSQGSNGVHRGVDDLAVSSHFPASPPRARGRTA